MIEIITDLEKNAVTVAYCVSTKALAGDQLGFF